jgi:uncharacterized protein YndB with AHSA1/START domain
MARISRCTDINAPRDRVFDALCTAEGLKGWYTPHIEGTVGEGQEATFRFSGRRPFRWRFAEITAPSGAHWECVEGPGAAAGTTVTFRLSDAGSGTRLECEHEGWDEGDAALATCETLWETLMHHLRDYAETATPAPAFQ